MRQAHSYPGTLLLLLFLFGIALLFIARYMITNAYTGWGAALGLAIGLIGLCCLLPFLL